MKFAQSDERIFDAFCIVASESTYRTDITMTKIAEKMGISKQALHKSYYKNVNEIICALHYYVDQEPLEKLKNFDKNNSKDLINFFAYDILPLLYKKRDYFQVIYGHIADPSWTKFIKDNYSTILFSYLDNTEKRFQINSEVIAHIVIRQVLSVLAAWLTSPSPENPLIFSKKFIYLMTHSTYNLLKEENQEG